MSTEKMLTKVIGGEVRFSYVHVFAAKLNEQSGNKEYSIALLIPKKNKTLIDKLKVGVNAAIEKGISTKWNGKKPANLKLPVRDGDKERPDNPEYAGMWFIGAKAANRPHVVGTDKDEDGNFVQLDEEGFYSGCWGNFSINFFPYSAKGNVGVGAGLLNLQKTRDDEKLSGGSTANEDFGGGKKDEEENEENPFG